MKYLDGICDVIDKVLDENKELFMLGDLNNDYFSTNCHLRKKLLSVANTCNLTQAVNLPTTQHDNAKMVANQSGLQLTLNNWLKDMDNKKWLHLYIFIV